MRTDFLFTSESVSEGHPDKVADCISDSILDCYLAADPFSRVAVETLVTTNRVVIAGEVRGPDIITPSVIKDVARAAIREIGYEQEGFHWQYVDIDSYIHGQSSDIAVGVDGFDRKEEGAGDQGMMFGYACDETPDFMPAPIYYSHKILRYLADKRRSGELPGFLPDAKCQVTLQYIQDYAVGAHSIVVSHQHEESLSFESIYNTISEAVAKILPAGWMCNKDNLYVNPTGRFVIGGPDGDTGLTGRKIIVDTYGGAAPHGGGAFSGKDPTKVDRSAAYAARYLARNVVSAGLARACTIQLSYAIGIAYPLSIYVNTHGTGKVDDCSLAKILPELLDLSPRGIRKALGLNCPIYKKTSSYGHFGRAPTTQGHFSWERDDLVNELKRYFL